MKHDGRFPEELALRLLSVFNELMGARKALMTRETQLQKELKDTQDMRDVTCRQLLHLGRFLNGFGVSLPDDNAFEAACAQVH